MTQNNSRYNGSGRKNTPPAEIAGRIPPRDIEMEEAVLGALMLEKDAYMKVCDILVPESFYEPNHQKIYSAISTLGFTQRPIDMLTVMEQLRVDGTLEEIGGAIRITELTGRVYSAANVEFHAKIIAQKYLARRLINFAAEVEGKAFDESNDVDDLLQEAEGLLFDISQTQLKREVVQIDPVLNEAIEQIQLAANSDTGLSGLQTGFTALDKITAGWQNSDLIIIAARPAMGKTAFVLSMAKNMAVNYNIPIGIFTLEMPNVQLVKRILSNVAELEGEKIKTGRLTPEEWDRLNANLKNIFSTPLYLDETPSLSITELRTKARRLVREHGVKMIMIDYLQLMTGSGQKFGSREQEVSTISRSLKAMAKELNIPIIALSQLNRSTETREDKRPVLSDLRESGAIEQDADIVCFIHRPEYYFRSGEDGAGNDVRGVGEIIIAKHRNGAVGDVKLRFVSKYARFEDWEKGYDMMQSAVRSSGKHLESRMNREAPPAPFEDVPPFPGNSSPFGTDGPAFGSSPFGGGGPDLMPPPGSEPSPF